MRGPVRAWEAAPVSRTGHRWPCELYYTRAERGSRPVACTCGEGEAPGVAGVSSQAGLATFRR